MSDFFKQMLIQLRNIWVRFNTLQKTILASVFLITFVGLVLAIAINSINGQDDGYVTLFANVDLQEAAAIVDHLKESDHPFKLENDGRTILVPKKVVHDVRMELARAGLPQQSGKGYEIFDKMQLGVTDFVQNLNYKRAVEAELTRSIETIKAIDQARVHIAVPKRTIFTEKMEEAEASVIIKIHPGEEITKKQVRGITHLVSSAIDNLKARKVTVLDQHGNMLTRGFADNEIAEQTDHNMELKKSVERNLETKVVSILEGVLGKNRARVKVSTTLDFDQISKKVESFDPKKKVVRSEQRDDGTRRNSPAIGDEVKEGAITNYEIDRTVAHIVNAPGSRKRITVSVAVDGTYSYDDGKRIYVPRKEEEIDVLTRLVKNAVGFDETGHDEIFVANVQFDNSYLENELSAMKEVALADKIEKWGLRLVILAVVLMGFVFLRTVIRNVATAMNPPLPKYAGIDLEVEEDEVPEAVRRQNEMLDRMEEMTQNNPSNVAELIRTWLESGETADNE
ncbi:MAG: flagellar basal-body MS-ring/collar protein FliF [Fibrobacterales bacterium]